MVASSSYFRAHLGQLDVEAAARLETWCEKTYAEHRIHRTPGEEVVLEACCHEPKTCKSILMALRTASSNMGCPLVLRGDDVELLAPESHDHATPPAAPPAPSIVAAVHASSPLCVEAALPRDFDERSLALYRRLVENGAIACAA